MDFDPCLVPARNYPEIAQGVRKRSPFEGLVLCAFACVCAHGFPSKHVSVAIVRSISSKICSLTQGAKLQTRSENTPTATRNHCMHHATIRSENEAVGRMRAEMSHVSKNMKKQNRHICSGSGANYSNRREPLPPSPTILATDHSRVGALSAEAPGQRAPGTLITTPPPHGSI